jgi:hypothetical protein
VKDRGDDVATGHPMTVDQLQRLLGVELAHEHDSVSEVEADQGPQSRATVIQRAGHEMHTLERDEPEGGGEDRHPTGDIVLG